MFGNRAALVTEGQGFSAGLEDPVEDIRQMLGSGEVCLPIQTDVHLRVVT
jgi:hypothetical protein